MSDVRYSSLQRERDGSRGGAMSAFMRIALVFLINVTLISGGVIGPDVGPAQAKERGLFATKIMKFFRNSVDTEQKDENNTGSDEKFQKYEGFMVHIADEKDVEKILLLDIALEIEKGEAQMAAHQLEIRKIIYRTSKEILSEQSRLSDVQKRLKQEIERRVNRCMRRSSVKGVYITRFTAL